LARDGEHGLPVGAPGLEEPVGLSATSAGGTTVGEAQGSAPEASTDSALDKCSPIVAGERRATSPMLYPAMLRLFFHRSHTSAVQSA
jgi:hypothetical protein